LGGGGKGELQLNVSQSEETTQAVGKMRFVVVSQFKESGLTVEEKLKHLLAREVQDKKENRTFEKANQT
jgi:hypothetical protein